MVSLGGKRSKGQRSLTLVALRVSLTFREAPLCSVPLSEADRQGVARWCMGTARRKSVRQTEGAPGCGLRKLEYKMNFSQALLQSPP